MNMNAFGAFLILCFSCCVSAAGTFNICDFGAKGDGKTINTDAIMHTISAAAQAGGGVVLVPAGKFLTSPFNLTSHITLFLERNAVLLGAKDKSLYPIIPPLPSYGKSRDVGYSRYQPLVFCNQCTDVRISGVGEGEIDGQGEYWWDLHKHKELKHGRPRLIEFVNCSMVEVTGVKLKNSGFWTLHPIYCNDVHIHDMTIEAPPSSPNTDGIDPDSSKHVLIERVSISCGDDHIAIKSGIDEYGLKVNISSENITIVDCTFYFGGGITIGSETSGGIIDVFANNNRFIGPAEKAVHIKSAPGRGNVVKNIWYNDTKVDAVAEAVSVSMHYSSAKAGPLPTFENVRISNLKGVSVKAGEFLCLDESPCTNFILENMDIEIDLEGFKCENVYGVMSNVKPKGCFLPSP